MPFLLLLGLLTLAGLCAVAILAGGDPSLYLTLYSGAGLYLVAGFLLDKLRARTRMSTIRTLAGLDFAGLDTPTIERRYQRGATQGPPKPGRPLSVSVSSTERPPAPGTISTRAGDGHPPHDRVVPEDTHRAEGVAALSRWPSGPASSSRATSPGLGDRVVLWRCPRHKDDWPRVRILPDRVIYTCAHCPIGCVEFSTLPEEHQGGPVAAVPS